MGALGGQEFKVGGSAAPRGLVALVIRMMVVLLLLTASMLVLKKYIEEADAAGLIMFMRR